MNVTTKNVDNFIGEFDILKIKNQYYVPEGELQYTEWIDTVNFEILDFTSLTVNNNDTLRIVAIQHIDRRNSILEVYNRKNGTRGYIKAYYGSDDTRCYLCNAIAKHFKDQNVTVQNYLIYNKEEVAHYIDSMYNL